MHPTNPFKTKDFAMNRFYPAPNPSAQQIESMDKLSSFLQRNNCAAILRDGEMLFVFNLENAQKYKSKKNILYSGNGYFTWETGKEFKTIVGRINDMLNLSNNKAWAKRKNKSIK